MKMQVTAAAPVVAALGAEAVEEELFALPAQLELHVMMRGMMIHMPVLALALIVQVNTTAPVSVLLNTP